MQTLAPLALAASSPALPQGGTFTSGSGSFAQSGSQLTINQSGARAIINWPGFSIDAGGTVFFNNGSGATLNRVSGGPASMIDGALRSTGTVYLINPQGVVIGPGGVVTAGTTPTGQVFPGASFIASTLDIKNDDAFKNGGTLIFQGTATAGVKNQGSISSTGDVFLFANVVTNAGSISASSGTVGLAAGSQILLREANGDQRVFVQAPGGDVTNSGSIAAVQAELKAAGGNIYALAGNNGNAGTIRATGTATVNGHVWLTADGGGGITNGGTISAVNADGGGGGITLSAPQGMVTNTGQIAANGVTGGQVTVTADRVLQQGQINADGSAGAGGSVAVNFGTGYVDSSGATLSVRGKGGTGGTVVLAGADGSELRVSGLILATGDVGGTVHLLASTITATGAQIDASGGRGGGAVRIGGDFHGGGDLRQATTVFIDPNTTIHADAHDTGAGGTIVAWSTSRTEFLGTSSARGGADGGTGGQREISSKGDLVYGGREGTGKGAVGSLLLDPADIVIDATAAAGIDTTLDGGGNVLVNASDDITVNSPINVTLNSGVTIGGMLTLDAGHSIFVNANISTAGGALTLTANDPGQSLVPSPSGTPAEITVASGVMFDTGTGGGPGVGPAGTVTVNLLAGANPSGAITLGGVNAGALSVFGGGDVAVGTVTNTAVTTANTEFLGGGVTVTVGNTTTVTGGGTQIITPTMTNPSAVLGTTTITTAGGVTTVVTVIHSGEMVAGQQTTITTTGATVVQGTNASGQPTFTVSGGTQTAVTTTGVTTAGGAVTLDAGHSVTVNGGISTSGGRVKLVAGDPGLAPLIVPPTPATIMMAPGAGINTANSGSPGGGDVIIELLSGSGTITLRDIRTTSGPSATGAQVVIDTTGTLVDGTDSAIVTNGLILIGPNAAFNLDTPGTPNDVNLLAASVGSLSFAASNTTTLTTLAVAVDSVPAGSGGGGGGDGPVRRGGTVSNVTFSGGTATVSGVTSSGTVLFEDVANGGIGAAFTITQSASGGVLSTPSLVVSDGAVNLSQPGNLVQNLATGARQADMISLNNAESLVLGTVNVLNGLTIALPDLGSTLTQTGAINTAVTGSSFSTGLTLTGLGNDFLLTNTGNQIGILTASVGTLSLFDSTSLTLESIIASGGGTSPGSPSLPGTVFLHLGSNVSFLTQDFGNPAAQIIVPQLALQFDSSSTGPVPTAFIGSLPLFGGNPALINTLAVKAGSLNLTIVNGQDLTIGPVDVGSGVILPGVTIGGTAGVFQFGQTALNSGADFVLPGFTLRQTGALITPALLLSAENVVLNDPGNMIGALANDQLLVISGGGSGGVTGSLSLTDGEDLSINFASITPNGPLPATNNGFSVGGTAAFDLQGHTLTQVSNLLTVTATGQLSADPRAGALTASSLLLKNGNFILDDPSNQIGTIAANPGMVANGAGGFVPGKLIVTDTISLTIDRVSDAVGSLGSVSGITNAGLVALNVDPNTPFRPALTMQIAPNSIIQTADGAISAQTLALLSTGGVVLNNSNNAVGTLAASVGDLSFTNKGPFSIGSATITSAPTPFQSFSAITPTGFTTVVNGVTTTVTLSNVIGGRGPFFGQATATTTIDGLTATANGANGSTGIITLAAGGAANMVTQSATGPAAITATALLLKNGSFSLTNSNNQIAGVDGGGNPIAGILAAASVGTLSVANNRDLVLGTVRDPLVRSSVAVSGVTAAGLVSFDLGNHNLSQDPGGAPIVAPSLLLKNINQATLTDPNNAVGTLAANVGALTFNNNAALTIGSAGGISGVTANGAAGAALGSPAVQIVANGNLTLANGVTVNTTGDLVLASPGHDFINNVGSGALVTQPGGRFLVYSHSPATSGNQENLGGLDMLNPTPPQIFGQTFAGLPPSSVSPTNPAISPKNNATLTATSNAFIFEVSQPPPPPPPQPPPPPSPPPPLPGPPVSTPSVPTPPVSTPPVSTSPVQPPPRVVVDPDTREPSVPPTPPPSGVQVADAELPEIEPDAGVESAEDAIPDDLPLRLGAFSIIYRQRHGEPVIADKVFTKDSSFEEALARHRDGTLLVRPANAGRGTQGNLTTP